MSLHETRFFLHHSAAGGPPNIPEGPSHIHQINAIRNDVTDKIVAYHLITPSGKEIELTPDLVEMQILTKVFTNAASDELEVMAPLHLAHRVKQAMAGLGLKEADLPKAPEEILDRALATINKGNELQKAITENREINAQQAVLDLVTETLTGDHRSFRRLNPAQKEIVLTFTQTLTVHLLRQIGINAGTLETAQIVKQIHLALRERQAGTLAVWLATSGQGVGDLVGGLLEGVIYRPARALLALTAGEHRAQRGLSGVTAGVVEDLSDSAAHFVGQVGTGAGRLVGNTTTELARGGKNTVNALRGQDRPSNPPAGY